MLHNTAQIVLGIVYGLYLAFLAPVSQRQQAHNRFYQQKKAVTPQVEAPLEVVAVESPSQWQLDVVEDPWLTNTTPLATSSYAKSAQIPQLFLPPASNSAVVPVAVATASNQATKTKQTKALVKIPDSTGAALTQMTAQQLRSLCSKHQIKWRNARGSNHLTKAEMIVALGAA